MHLDYLVELFFFLNKGIYSDECFTTAFDAAQIIPLLTILVSGLYVVFQMKRHNNLIMGVAVELHMYVEIWKLYFQNLYPNSITTDKST